MSKGLEALNRTIERLQNGEKIIVRDYVAIEKELKALEIIKNKGVFVHLLQQSQNVEEYNSLMLVAFKKMVDIDYNKAVEMFGLTQEEFNLIKEWLER